MKQRLNIQLPSGMVDRLEYMQKQTEAASITEVIRKACRLYDAILQEVEDGGDFCIRDKNGILTVYKVLI